MSDAITPDEVFDPNSDPVLAQRELIRKKVRKYKLIGYTLMTYSIIAIALCVPMGWPAYLTISSMVAFVASCVILPLPIIFGYAIKAAEREDKKMGF